MTKKENGPKVLSRDNALNLARQGKKAWNDWAGNNTGCEVDFSGCNFCDENEAVTFDGFKFPGVVNFSDAVFPDAVFIDIIFEGAAIFNDATFQANAEFTFITARGLVKFENTAFKENALFQHNTYRSEVYFRNTTFEGESIFNSDIFERAACFGDCAFKQDVAFYEVTFKQHTTYENTTFEMYASFHNTTFERDAIFEGVNFKTGSTFGGAMFSGLVSLDECQFGSVPDFRRCEFKKHVTLHGINVTFSQPTSTPDADKYRRLKEIAVVARDHDREQMFFACELRAKRYHETVGLSLIPNYIYDWTSDFGRSLWRPFIGLFTVWIVFGNLYLTAASKDMTYYWESLLFSAAQLFPFLGISRTINSVTTKGALFGNVSVSNCVAALSGVEGILGIILLFLIGLALRNRFRI